MSPVISVIIPLYNKRQSIFSTIDSVLNQSYRDFELLVIDDGSTDGSGEIVKAIQDSRIRYIWKENGGVSSARNRGIEEAKGEWILFLDADDYLIEDGLEHLVKGVRKYPQCKVITDNSSKSIFCTKKKDIIYDVNRLKAYAEERINIRTGNTLFHKECFEKCGFFDERLSLFEDYKLFADIIHYYPVVQIGECVFSYDTDFCGLSTVRGVTDKDYLWYLTLTDDDEFNKCIYNFLGMRLNWAKKENDKKVIEFIKRKFNAEKALAVNAISNNFAHKKRTKATIIYFLEIVRAMLKGHIETNKVCLLSLSPSRYGKYGNGVKIGKHSIISKASKVFIYDRVSIGSNLHVDNSKGKFIVRSGTRIGDNLHVTTFNDEMNMNVVIGKNVTIGDNVSLSAGTYIHDNEVIPSNTIA